MNCPAGKCECVHYKHANACKTNSDPMDVRDIEGFENCPWPSKIQAPKDPWQECEDQLYYERTNNGLMTKEGISRILKKYWPKDKPKGDRDKAWNFLYKSWNQHQGRVTIGREELEAALKAGGFIE